MGYWRLILGLVLGLLILASCGQIEQGLVPVELGRIDFIADSRLLDVRTDPDSKDRIMNGFQFLKGWTRSGPGGKWAVGSSAEIEFSATPNARFLWIECRPDSQLDGPQVVTVVVDGVVTGEFRPEPGGFNWHQIELAPSNGETIRHMELRFEHARSADRVAAGGDTRPLALMIRRLALTHEPEMSDKMLQSPAIKPTPRGMRVKRAGRLYINFRSQVNIERVEIGIRPHNEGGTAVPLTLVHSESGEHLSQTILETRSKKGTRVWLEAGGRSGAFQIVVDVGDEGVAIDRIQASIRLDSATTAPVEPSETSTESSQPDIVVIVLDAARADHSGSTYGYAKDTMPNIDRFAADSIVFDRVFAQAPYTTCSVPTMFTGLGWGTHGVVRGKDRLPEEEETLAESLRASGYQTIGFTATPNNSKRLGMDQGFDEFEHLWDYVSWQESIDPMVAVDLLKTRLHQGLDEKPLFLMLHLVPPHSPYTPPENFRVFSDPEYDGPCDGTKKYLKSTQTNPESVLPGDVAEMLALYDGNLRFSDAAVGDILEALADTGRLDRAVVAITADHGEAFFEHGHRGHNSSIYDEMLQVPLIIRLPRGVEVKAIDRDRLASLEDLTPTLLGLAGVSPSPRMTGVDLFSGPPRSGVTLRTTEAQSTFGFRSGDWKLIADGGGNLIELYDLVQDPGENTNVLLLHPEKVSWLADRWDRAESVMPPRLEDVNLSDVSMTDTEKSMLRELGYID